ncbi:MAG: translation initiation factor IF-2, partial [Bacteroidetes bacterium]|nr:translation initiation factor IF-2 [Bacteroidota bacterium]
MAKRLIKIAKELNVGTSTIVEHLHNNGFEIENKPTAKISEEMYAELLKEFQKSIAIKEKAQQLIIGNRPSGEPKKEEPQEQAKEKTAPPTPKKAEQEPSQEAPEAPATENGKTQEPDTPAKEPQKTADKESGTGRKAPGWKIKGKIELDKDKKAAPKARQEEKPAEKPTPQADKPTQEEQPAEKP